MTPPASAPEFLARSGWEGARVEPLAVDASFRRYFRVIEGERKAVLMDAPPPHEDPVPFLKIAEYLAREGLRAPRIYQRDLARGLVLLEDLGDRRMREHLDRKPGEEREIYRRAVDLLLRLHRLPAADLPFYSELEYLREAELLTDWYCPAMGLDVDREAFVGLWKELLAPVIAAQRPAVTVLRDYHAENLMLLDDGELGLLDFQDALAGHRGYDLVSLLQDARRDVPPAIESEMVAHYRQGAGDPADFSAHYAILGAQRNAKIIGIFTRLWKRDGKPRFLSYMPRMWGLLERDLESPELAPLKSWFDANIPPEARRRPADVGAAER